MSELPTSIPIVILLLTVFLSCAVGMSYGIRNNFLRTRLLMTFFFVFIVLTLSVSFWGLTLATLPYTIPAFGVGALMGYVLGVRTERQKLAMQGLGYYMEHFAHVHPHDFQSLTWWSFVNFYSVMGGLFLINLVGLSNVIFDGVEFFAIATSVFGAFLIGTIVPYLAHLWSIRVSDQESKITSVE